MGRRRRRRVEDCNRGNDRVDEITIHADKVIIRADRVIVEEQDRRGHHNTEVAGDFDKDKRHDRVEGDDKDHHDDFRLDDVEDKHHSGRHRRRDPWSRLF